jgi:hypothetical protein
MRVEVDVATDTGSAVVEFTIRLDTVDVRYGGRCVAILDRRRLRAWLARPAAWWATDDVQWGLSADGRVVLVVVDACAWALTPRMVTDLREQL